MEVSYKRTETYTEWVVELTIFGVIFVFALGYGATIIRTDSGTWTNEMRQVVMQFGDLEMAIEHPRKYEELTGWDMRPYKKDVVQLVMRQVKRACSIEGFKKLDGLELGRESEPAILHHFVNRILAESEDTEVKALLLELFKEEQTEEDEMIL